MPLKFVYLCDLLQQLENLETPDRDGPLLRAHKETRHHRVIFEWFNGHRKFLESPDIDRVALLSSFFPEKRTDRVYWLQPASLSKVLSRCLGLGTERLQRLQSWTLSSHEDLALWVSNLVKVTDAGMVPSNLTVEEIDQTLDRVAARCRFSSPEVRSRWPKLSTETAHSLLKPLIVRLPSHELKWFLRLVLKNFHPVVLEESFVLRQIHFLLPNILKFQSSFEAAVAILSSPSIQSLTPRPDHQLEELLMSGIGPGCLRPQIGVKIGMPTFEKARSLQRCLKLVKNGRWAVEPKVDGEYCQVHVDLSKGQDCIQLFAKSGKDATIDRGDLHGGIKRSLRIGDPDCKFKHKCILEGEMVVYNEKKASISEYHKIRKHVSRAGSFLGTENDSQAHAYERLMLVFFDVLLIDDEITMALHYETRRRRLKDIVVHLEGCAERMEWGVIDFSALSERRARRKLEKLFSKAIARRLEGLVLKPCDRPYFSLRMSNGGFGGFIKLKKDYIPGLGDTADFVVVGAARDSREQTVVGAKWNCFVIACIVNKDAVTRFAAVPIFRLLCSLSRPCIAEEDMIYMSNAAICLEITPNQDNRNDSHKLLMADYDARIDVEFKKPFIVEVLGSSFSKPPSKAHYMLRHPRIIKIHGDRGLEDVVSFDELQNMALDAVNVPADPSLEASKLRHVMESACRPKRPVYVTNRSPFSESTSKTTTSTTTTPSKTLQHNRRAPLIRIDSCELLPGETPNVRSPPKKDPASDSRISSEVYMCTPSSPSPIPITVQEIPPRNLHETTFSIAESTSKRKRDDGFNARLTTLKSPKNRPFAEVTDSLTNQASSESSQLFLKRAEGLENNSTAGIDSPAGRIHLFNSGRGSSDSFYSATSEQAQKQNSAEIGKMSTDLQSRSHSAHTKFAKWRTLRFCTVYVSPCLHGTPYLIENLLPTLSPANITTSLSHWERDLLHLPSCAPVVGESQACQGMQKIVLAETRRDKQTKKVVERLKRIKLCVGEVVEIWDWRMAERLVELLDLGEAEGNDERPGIVAHGKNTDVGNALQALNERIAVDGEHQRKALLSALASCYLGHVAWKDENGRNGWFAADDHK